MKRHTSISTAAQYLFTAALGILLAAGLATAQTAGAPDTTRTASSTIGITVTISRDTSGKRADSLSTADTARGTADTVAATSDTARGAVDTLAISPDTTGAKRDTLAARKDTLEILTSTASYNTIPGFRVQILTTQSLSEAINVKAEADSLLSGYNVYIVYDSPYYKVRVGDFRARYEAAQAATYIADHGFPNAWSVPDNVFRNPLRKNN